MLSHGLIAISVFGNILGVRQVAVSITGSPILWGVEGLEHFSGWCVGWMR